RGGRGGKERGVQKRRQAIPSRGSGVGRGERSFWKRFMPHAAELEALTHDYGREIFGRLVRNGPILFTPRWWDDRLMGWSMRDQAVKVQLFRFVDVLPMLRSPPAIVGHLREYFAEAGKGVPGWLRLGLRLL